MNWQLVVPSGGKVSDGSGLISSDGNELNGAMPIDGRSRELSHISITLQF